MNELKLQVADILATTKSCLLPTSISSSVDDLKLQKADMSATIKSCMAPAHVNAKEASGTK
jgi:hypothetical protein